ncbi:Ig-like domain repeat protein [Nocardia bhagyanarayanae]|uniref:Ig-like domain-containing protein n=1 Tax=Nocardia bhagyanarayanae TaxID=1215925 RepID=A0A543EYC2_9NOCA|nr:Ig-like domain repeat protein [Nocardia bhagyanarayanae]TQM26576.1 hypothetical protein FB390_6777 [Nocardia bhagyanarayanae]
MSVDRNARRRRIRATVVASACAGAAGIALAAAPGAHATATRIGVLPDLGYGLATNFGTGCSYTIQAFVTDAVSPVSFYDNGIPLATVAPTGGVALLKWVPETPGAHTISVVQAPDRVSTAATAVPVGTGMHIGHGCAVFGG